MSKEEYIVDYHCCNCGAKGTISIEKGKLVSSSVCPHCGCRTIVSIPKEIYKDGNWKYPWSPGCGDLFNRQNPYPWDTLIA